MPEIAAFGFLGLSFVFPETDILEVGSLGRLGVTLLGAVPNALVVVGAATGGGR